MGDRQERKKSIWGGMFKGSKNKGEASEMTPLNQTSAATGRGKSKIDLLLLLLLLFFEKDCDIFCIRLLMHVRTLPNKLLTHLPP